MRSSAIMSSSTRSIFFVSMFDFKDNWSLLREENQRTIVKTALCSGIHMIVPLSGPAVCVCPVNVFTSQFRLTIPVPLQKVLTDEEWVINHLGAFTDKPVKTKSF